MDSTTYTVYLCPPDYPRRQCPFSCRHPPEFQMLAGAQIVPGHGVRLDRPMCMACGAPIPGTRGNVLACIEGALEYLGHDPKIGGQLRHLRTRYSWIALRLFGPDGWKGRRRRWSGLIDPNLTMRIFPKGRHADGTWFFMFHIDESYFAPAVAHDPTPKKPRKRK